MKIVRNENLPDSRECAASLRNVIDALYVLNGKWKLPLILSIMQSSKRFNQIQHEMTGISAKVLAKELRDLELNYFIKRNVISTTPHSIVYEATPYSKTLKNVLGELSAWGQQHRENVKNDMREMAAGKL
jgi:DNA-binding HxlR family transcriptional regulator